MKMKVSVAIDDELLRRLDRIRDISRESRSQILDRMIRESIEGAEQFANMLANPKVREEMVKVFANPQIMQSFALAMGDKPSAVTSQKMVEAVESIGQTTEKIKKGKGKK
ncbi:MAG: hypothetical protein WCI73_11050 [Phycisphaerae bacterium]